MLVGRYVPVRTVSKRTVYISLRVWTLTYELQYMTFDWIFSTLVQSDVIYVKIKGRSRMSKFKVTGA